MCTSLGYQGIFETPFCMVGLKVFGPGQAARMPTPENLLTDMTFEKKSKQEFLILRMKFHFQNFICKSSIGLSCYEIVQRSPLFGNFEILWCVMKT